MSNVKRIIYLVVVLVLIAGLALPTYAAGNQAEITACVIDSEHTDKVTVNVQIVSNISSDDGKLYLFAIPAYENSISGYTPVASADYAGSGACRFTVDLNNNTSSSLLYNKFYVGVKQSGTYTAVTEGHYITNPEAIAPSNVARTEAASKKGIHMTMSIPTELEEMGMDHSYFGIAFQDFISNTETENAYTYNGKTYYFTNLIKDYDNLISNMSRAGIVVTVTLCSEYRDGYEYLLHPDADQREGTSNYALNTTNQQGVEILAAATHFLAERYNGTNPAYGKVDNWIVGNEVNDNLQYYYMGEKKIDAYVQDYLRSFRVLHTAIKSAYSNANVYIGLQHRWNVEYGTGDYAGKDFIDLFNRYAKAQGNIDWGVSYHPYSFPMNDPDILNDGEATLDQNNKNTDGGEVRNELSTPIITMKNISVLTNYFHNPELLNPNGQVRSIILGEQGYTSYSNIYGKNEAKQAANIALAYYIAEMNEDIDAFLLRTLTDENEGNEYFRFGLRDVDAAGKPGNVKYAWEMYKYINTADTFNYTNFAKDALNISDWSEVVPNWDSSIFAAMGTRKEGNLYTVDSATSVMPVTTGMFDVWEPSYNVYDIVYNDHSGKPYPLGTAVANSFAYYREYQGIETHFETPVNLSAADYLTMDVKFTPYSADYASDRLEFKVRLHSGNDVYDAIGVVSAGVDYKICVDLKGWAGKSSIDWMEVLVREYEQERSFAGTFTVYNVAGAAGVTNQKALERFTKTFTDLSGAELAYQKNFNYSGSAATPKVTVKLNGQTLTQHENYDVIYHNNVKAGEATVVVIGIGDYSGCAKGNFTIQGGFPTVYEGIDYAPVYAYGYYKENNPMVVEEVGDDPNALLEHFVTKGMKYALQGVGNFNVLAYAKINTDLVNVFGDDWAAYYLHYLTHGIEEGRSTSGIKPEGIEAPVYPGTPETPSEDPTEPEPPTENPKDCSKGHTYDDNVDGTCNVCGVNRETVETRQVTHMFRMYNPNTGEHFYTGSEVEKGNLVAAGWHYEGVGFTFPANTGAPVHRLFQPSTGEHLYTMDDAEKDRLLADGWNYEGIAFNSAYNTEAVQHRLHNPNAIVGAYHFTFSEEEKQALINAGWEYQGIGWYSCWK